MMKCNAKIIWRIFLVIVLVSWIPMNLWICRHDDALLDAVISGDLMAVKRTVDYGADVHMPIRRNFTLLQVAAKNHDDVEIARFLIEKGVSPGVTNDDGDTALSIARSSGHDRMAELLLKITSESEKKKPNKTWMDTPH